MSVLSALLDRLLDRLVPPPVPMVLYTRPGCGLCEEMLEEIRRARPGRPWSLTEVDVGQDPELERRHGTSIPVLWIGGRLAFKGRLTAADFERKFARLAGEWDRARELAEGLARRAGPPAATGAPRSTPERCPPSSS